MAKSLVYSSDAAERTVSHYGELGIRKTDLSNTFVEYDLSSLIGRWVELHCTEAAYVCDGATTGFTPSTSAAATPTQYVVKPLEAGEHKSYFVSAERPFLQVATRVSSGTAVFTLNTADNNPQL